MQGENGTSVDFLRRTDELALAMGISVQDLPEALNIGRASLFACRSGKRPISQKTWLKLEQAEILARLKTQKFETPAEIEEEASPYHPSSKEQTTITHLEARISNMELLLHQVLQEMRELKTTDAERRSSKAHGKKIS